ncbi:MAG: hypothetical protein HYX91_02160 [Chloroflexi bacterium]|nr:hypothetical protein [Chloroflexota bacterium]
MGKEVKIILAGTPEEVAPHIIRVAEFLKVQELNYCATEEFYATSEYSKELTIMCGTELHPGLIMPDKEPPDRHTIGHITLQSLPNNKTLFIARIEQYDFNNADYYFTSFLETLLLELKRIGFLATWPKKVWHVMKELIGIVKIAR